MSIDSVRILLDEGKKKPSMQEMESFAYPDLALFCKVLFDKLEKSGYGDFDTEDKIDLIIKFLKYTAQRPSKLRQNIRRLVGAKPKTLAREIFIDL